MHWIRDDKKLHNSQEMRYMVRIRYRQALVPAVLHQHADGLYILFDELVKAVAPGQFAAWYDGEELVGSGVIQ